MSDRKAQESKLQARLEQAKSEIAELKEKLEQAEVNLELEYYTLIDELHLKLQSAEQKFVLLKQADEEKWEEFKSEFEQSWKSLRELIKAITAP